MKSTTSLLSAALVLGAATAFAGTVPTPVPSGKSQPTMPSTEEPCDGPISYNNIELTYSRTDFDGNLDDGDDIDLRVEFAPASRIHLTGGLDYLSTSYDFERTTVDIEEWKITAGVGGHISLCSHIDLSGDIGGIWADRNVDYNLPGANFPDDDKSEWGWYIRPELRGKWGCFTAHLGAEYRDVKDDEKWNYFGKVFYQVAPGWDISLGYKHDEDSNTYSGGIRWHF